MKIKGSRVGRKFQALIPDLLTETEREQNRMLLQCGIPKPTAPIQSDHAEDLSNPQNRSPNSQRHSNLSNRLYEQRIPNSSILNTNLSISKDQYDRIVKGPRKRYMEALESKRRKYLNRRTGRRRVMRCQNYKEWDERGFSDEQSEGGASPKPSELDISSTKKLPQMDKKRARSSDGLNVEREKKRRFPNKKLKDVIDLVDLSDSPEVAHCLMQMQQIPITMTTPRRRKSTGVKSTRIGDVGGIDFQPGKGNSMDKQHSESLPAVPINVLTNLGASSQNRQPLIPPQRIIGRLSGFRPSSSNSTGLIPVIEL